MNILNQGELKVKDMTLINVILDRSGSMGVIGIETVGMFNRFLEEQKKGNDYAELSLIQFDDLYQEDYIRKPIKECESLELNKTYIPRGLTALFDAVGKTVNKVGHELDQLPESEKPKRVLCVIITDGHENNSKEYNKETVQQLIKHQQSVYNWDFVFLGAGIDAYDEGAKLGIMQNKCASFDKSAQGIASAGVTLDSYSSVFRSSGNVNLNVEDHRG